MMGGVTFRRVVVGHGSVEGADILLDLAAGLAEIVQGQLVGLFVEETALVDLADLPFSQVVRAGSGTAQNFSRAALQEAFSEQASAFRQAIMHRARDFKISCDFDRTQGDLMIELSSRCEPGDIAVISAPTGGITAGDAVTMARGAMGQLNAVIVAPFETPNRHGPIVAINEGNVTDKSAAILAARLAARLNLTAMVSIIAGNDQQADRMEQDSRAILGDENVIFHRWIGLDISEVAEKLSHVKPWLLVANLESNLFSADETAIGLIAACRSPVLFLQDD